MATSRTGTAKHKNWAKQVLRQGQRNNITNCPTCGIHLDYEHGRRPNSAEPDHIIPVALGGRSEIENGRILCRRCNQSRGDGTKHTPSIKKRNPVPTIDFGA